MKRILSVILCLVLLMLPLTGNAESKNEIARRVAQQIVDEVVTPEMSPYEAACVLYDYVCDHMDYVENISTAYRAVVEGIGDCGGYSRFLQHLWNVCGINNKLVSGTYFGNGHQWNAIKLDDEWYFVDARLGDHVDDGYLRFCCSYPQMKEMGYTMSTGYKNYTAVDYYCKCVSGELDDAVETVTGLFQKKLDEGRAFFAVDLYDETGLDYAPDWVAVEALVPREYKTADGETVTVTIEREDGVLLVEKKVKKVKVNKVSVKQSTYTFTVSEADLPMKADIDLKKEVTVTPENATNKTVVFLGKNDTVVDVDYYTGELTLLAPGSARIAITSTDNSGKAKKITIKVKTEDGEDGKKK